MDCAGQSKKGTAIKCAIFFSGVFLTFGGYLSLLHLQSSINIEDGVGAAAVTATYATAGVFGVIFTPVILRKLGPKLCLLLCEFAYLVFIVMNVYPVAYTLIPAGVLTGMGEATMWPVMTLFVVHYARCYAKHAKKNPESYIMQFIGFLYVTVQSSGTVGNLISYGVLNSGGGTTKVGSDDNTSTAIPPVFRDLSICGKNDCQDPNLTDENSDRYEPASPALIYILVGVMSGFVLSAMIIHQCLVKAIDPSLEILDEVQKMNESKAEEKFSFRSMIAIIKATLLHMINPLQILLTPFALYCGLQLTFGFSEVTRAFGSCMLGVENVGLLTALLLACDAVTSYCSCKIASKVGRNIPLLFGFCLNIANYMICLLWVPTESSLWVVYVIFVFLGVNDGIWQPLVNEMHATCFPENRDIALTIWNMYTLVGIAWQTGWSTSLCVELKIYIQIGILIFSMICYGIANKIYHNKMNPAKNIAETWKYGTKL